MYKIIFVDSLSFSGAEEMLNEAAEENYRVVGVIQLTNRAAVIMERKAVRGRPKLSDGEAELGE